MFKRTMLILSIMFACNLYAIPHDIVIVGGGFAGLSAAHTLHQKNPRLNWLLVEARDRFGGRTETIDVAGQPVDMGAEYVDREHEEMFALMKELQVDYEGLTLADDVIVIQDKKRISANDLMPAFNNLIDQLKRLSDSLKGESSSSTETPFLRYDSGLKCWAYKDLYSRLTLSDIEKKLLQALVRDEDGVDLEEKPLLQINSLIEMLDTYKTALNVKKVPLFGNLALRAYNYIYRIKGGTKTLIDALIKAMPAEKLSKGKVLTRVTKVNDIYRLNFQDGSTIEANNLIITTPFSVLHSKYGILDDASIALDKGVREAIDHMTYGTNSKIVYPTSKTTFRYAINLDEGTTGWSNKSGLTIMLGGTPGRTLDERAEIPAGTLTEIEKNFFVTMTPKLKPIVKNWSLDPFSLGSYSVLSQRTCASHLGIESKLDKTLYAFATEELEKGLVFAGEHTVFDRTGYMNSAVIAGQAAAKLMLRRLEK